MGKVHDGKIVTTSGFKFNANAPLDDREVVQARADLNNILAYEGIEVYVVEETKSYKYIAGNWVPIATEDYVNNKITEEFLKSGWTSDQISLLEVILNNIAYIDTTTGQTAANRLIASLRSGGWTSDQISLLEVILNNTAYIDTTTGQTASDRLIASLRGSGTGTSDDISQSGSVLTIRALANTPTQSESVLSIT